jgi:hypothetical protein
MLNALPQIQAQNETINNSTLEQKSSSPREGGYSQTKPQAARLAKIANGLTGRPRFPPQIHIYSLFEGHKELGLFFDPSGFMLCAWNGLRFDLKWIGHQAGNMPLAARIALKSYDPMFQFFNVAGFYVGLAKVAEAMDIPQEKLMNSSDAPKEWGAGNHQKVMDYVVGDCQMTNLIVLAIQEAQMVQWVTARGTVSSKPMPPPQDRQ